MNINKNNEPGVIPTLIGQLAFAVVVGVTAAFVWAHKDEIKSFNASAHVNAASKRIEAVMNDPHPAIESASGVPWGLIGVAFAFHVVYTIGKAHGQGGKK